MARFVDIGTHNAPYLVNLDLVERVYPLDDGTAFVFASTVTQVQIPFSEVVQRIAKVITDGSRSSSRHPGEASDQ